MQFLLQAQIALNARLWQEVEPINHIVVASDPIYASEPLNQPHRIPMKVIVDDLVAILQVQTFGEYVSGDHRLKLDFTGLELVLGVCFRCESPDKLCLTLV